MKLYVLLTGSLAIHRSKSFIRNHRPFGENKLKGKMKVS